MQLPLIDIHTHRPEPNVIAIRNVRLSAEDPTLPEEGYFSAGIHPWDAATAQEEWLAFFATAHPRLLAVGETGLDLRPAYALLPIQEKWLERQIDIANRLRKPLIIHHVRTTQALQKILKNRVAVPVVLHGFIGAPESARQWLEQLPDCRFSFGPTTLRSPKTQEALRWVATARPERLFLETDDDPNLSIRDMYAFAAALIGWSGTRLEKCIALNFKLLFPNILSE